MEQQSEYQKFLESKRQVVNKDGFDVSDSDLSTTLFDFQKHIVKKAIKAAKYAIFSECGTGKTIMQLECARLVSEKCNKPFLTLANLGVSQQTKNEADRFGYKCERIDKRTDLSKLKTGNYITNYEQLKDIDTSYFCGVALDESSILKNQVGCTKKLIIEKFKDYQYKFAFTATPAPNDHLELGNHAEFLDICTLQEMQSIFFINDAFNKDKRAQKWRLKKHCTADFWRWVSKWSIFVSDPSDIGFNSKGYDLPPLNISEILIKSPKQDNGKLFNDESVSATEYYKELSKTTKERCAAVAELVNNSDENFIIWVKTDEDESQITALIPDSVCVNGKMQKSKKEAALIGFSRGEFRVLVTKTKIAQFGLNYQNCHNQIFLSFDFSFEALYQGIRRSWRFGQKNAVNIKLVTVDTMGNVLKSIQEKQSKFEKMKKGMQAAINSANKEKDNSRVIEMSKGHNYTLYNGDSIEVVKKIDSKSIDFSFFSPPFSDLYMYSDDKRDLSNNSSYQEFFDHFKFLIKELNRVVKDGRLIAVHLTQLATTKGRDGVIKVIDFRGDVIRAFEDCGLLYHGEVCIRKDPKIIAQRTKNMQLLHATTKKDSCKCRMSFADYIVIFRVDGENQVPVNHDKNGIEFSYWCKIAEPVWLDIEAGEVLNVSKAKDEKDEKHMTPTQLEPIRRLIDLYTNPNEVVFSPFNGVGSEGVVSIEKGRKYVGIELKKSYFDIACSNLQNAEKLNNQLTIF